jgi:hypothetical protein
LEDVRPAILEFLEFLEKSPPGAVLVDAGGARRADAAGWANIDKGIADLLVGQGQ